MNNLGMPLFGFSPRGVRGLRGARGVRGVRGVHGALPNISINTINNDVFVNMSNFELTEELRAVKVNLTTMVDTMMQTITKSDLISLWENIDNVVKIANSNMLGLANSIQFKNSYEPNFINCWANITLLMPSFKEAPENLWLDKTNEETAIMLSGFSLMLQGMINANLVLAPLAVEKMSKTWINADPNIIPFALSEGVKLCLDMLQNVLSNEILYENTGFDDLQRDINLYATAWNVATTYTAQIMLGITGNS